jgi:hypothetical protein
VHAYRSVGDHAVVPLIMLCPFGLAAEADHAERARAVGAEIQLAEARSVGLALLKEARAAAGGILEFGKLADVATLKAAMAKAEAEWTRLEGRSDPPYRQAARPTVAEIAAAPPTGLAGAVARVAGRPGSRRSRIGPRARPAARLRDGSQPDAAGHPERSGG